jgi:putative transposase
VDGRIFLPKAGWTAMVMHRPVLGKVRNVTVSELAREWHVSIQVEHLAEAPANRGPAVRTSISAASRPSCCRMVP